MNLKDNTILKIVGVDKDSSVILLIDKSIDLYAQERPEMVHSIYFNTDTREVRTDFTLGQWGKGFWIWEKPNSNDSKKEFIFSGGEIKEIKK